MICSSMFLQSLKDISFINTFQTSDNRFLSSNLYCISNFNLNTKLLGVPIDFVYRKALIQTFHTSFLTTQ